MKKFFSGLVATIFFTINLVAASCDVVDKTLAVVNGESVLMSEFNSIFLPIFEQYKQNKPVSDQKENELKDIILNQKIEYILLKQEVKKQKIKVSRKELQDSISEIKKRFTNEAEFIAELKKENITIVNFEKELSDKIAVIKLIKQFVEPKTKKPSEAEVKALYDKIVTKMKGSKLKNVSKEEEILVGNLANILKGLTEEQVRLRQIFINSPKNMSKTQEKAIKDKIATVKKELQKHTFVEVAAKYSEDINSKARNGDLGLFAKSGLPIEISRIVFSMKLGGYTKEPIKTEDGYHFIKIEEKKAKRDLTFEDVKNDIAEVLLQENFKDVYADYVSDLRTKANIKINKTW
ncbi:MAG: peptidylprolyl isomerase [Endomicrobium sp.]|jgi:parvulin-like peptidyl-prolyl isomerase|nr:peptidylprolyl isomerase [Endomicrobium sp.]